MIIKVLTRKQRVNDLVKYVLQEKKQDEERNRFPVVLKKNLHGAKERWGKQIMLNNTLRKQTKNMVACYHTIISFHPKDNDKITKNMLKDIGQKFVDLRAPDAQHLVTYHTDKTHVHLHVVTGGTRLFSSKATRQSKADFSKMKIELEKYQMEKYPQLSYSVIQTKDKTNRVAEIKNTRTAMKEKLNNELAKLYSQSKDMKAFFTSVEKNGYTLYERGGKITGLIDQDLKYRFSKLGFDKDKLNYLDSQAHQTEKEMQKLVDIRNSRTTNRDKEEEGIGRTMEQEEQRDDEIENSDADDDNDDMSR